VLLLLLKILFRCGSLTTLLILGCLTLGGVALDVLFTHTAIAVHWPRDLLLCDQLVAQLPLVLNLVLHPNEVLQVQAPSLDLAKYGGVQLGVSDATPCHGIVLIETQVLILLFMDLYRMLLLDLDLLNG
jgi:hypothetical protein